jgi:hypothetical protein
MEIAGRLVEFSMNSRRLAKITDAPRRLDEKLDTLLLWT